MNVKETLQVLSEDDLRIKVIMPLLFALGCSDVRANCGQFERGKDVIYINTNHFLKNKVWGAVVLKAVDITKKVLLDVDMKINEAITRFNDPDDPVTKVRVHEIIVATSRKMTDEAQKYLSDNSGKQFHNIHFINGDRMDFLINQVIIDYNKKNGIDYVFDVDTFRDICGKQCATLPNKSKVIAKTEGQPVE